MKELIAFILQFGNLHQQQIDLVLSKAQKLYLPKDSYFSEAGKIPKYAGFVVEGVLRGCYYTNEGKEITRSFVSENSILYDYVNFEDNSAATQYIQACTDCKLIVFSKKDWDELSQIIVNWDTIKNKMIQACMYSKSRKGPVVSQDGTTRYLEFLKNHPLLVNRIPLRYIASYLGVTQQSLSRIRKNIQ
ncbi:Crp/Fnr family transcriptional regulator [Galbibacter sp.]|uniref:Crp/Fnr family transcriptional regulator n=1 Tax=Galbibacter sp. TaxID=2918471 RepID=UPI002B99F64B|nr:Crp/Fnr family transcriptional regulator [Galbibacter sp.]HLV62345.1 Crp/Fnr family transcriptional regulator [Galbibacter sp.]